MNRFGLRFCKHFYRVETVVSVACYLSFLQVRTLNRHVKNRDFHWSFMSLEKELLANFSPGKLLIRGSNVFISGRSINGGSRVKRPLPVCQRAGVVVSVVKGSLHADFYREEILEMLEVKSSGTIILSRNYFFSLCYGSKSRFFISSLTSFRRSSRFLPASA